MCFSNEHCCNTLRLPITSKAPSASRQKRIAGGIGHIHTHHPSQSGYHKENTTSSNQSNPTATEDCPSADDIIKCIDGAVGRDRDHESECMKLRAKFRACIMMMDRNIH
mmetsp:Transcript_38103/g.77544  ORF Transcript_38103/g.77544 Transcript_38103/m.77544 type:complete len:109 (+) Transcript_38103:267-593(+)